MPSKILIGATNPEDAKKLTYNDQARNASKSGALVAARPVFILAMKEAMSTKNVAKRFKETIKLDTQGEDELKQFYYNATGKAIVDGMKRIINNRKILVANAPSTIKRKGFNWPLRDTGALLNGLTWKVE